MKNNLKRLLLCIMVFTFTVGSSAYAQKPSDNMIFDLTSLGIFEKADDYRLNDYMTRAEFAKVVSVLTNCKDICDSAEYKGCFKDVMPESWYWPYVETNYLLGVFSGGGDGMFYPYAYASTDEVIKTIVCVLGYSYPAEKEGGYPLGYRKIAINLGLYKNVESSESCTRGMIAQIVYNALDVKIMQKEIVSNTAADSLYYVDDGDVTLKDAILGGSVKTEYFEGILRADSYTYTDIEVSSLKNDEVLIGNTIYKTAGEDVHNYIGMYVEGYAYSGNDGRMVLKSLRAAKNNRITNVKYKDYIVFSNSDFSYFDNGSTRHYRIDGTMLYNGLPVLQMKPEYIRDTTVFSLIDNDDDGVVEILKIDTYEIGIVEHIGDTYVNYKTENMSINKSIVFDKDDSKSKFVIYDADNKVISLSDIKKDSVLAVFVSTDGSRKKCVMSDSSFEGYVETVGSDTIEIGGTEYEIRCIDATALKFDKKYRFYLDYLGNIAAVKEISGSDDYMYIVGYHVSGIDNFSAKAITSGNVSFGEDIDIDNIDASAVPVLICKNGSINVYEFADTTNINGKKYKKSKLKAFFDLQTAPVFKYELDNDGLIKKLTAVDLDGGSFDTKSKYNVYDQCFGGSEYVDGFFINKESRILCIPTNPKDDDDYMVSTRIDVSGNSVGYLVQGYDRDEISGACRLVVVTKAMDADLLRNVQLSSSKLSIVTKNRVYIADNGEYYREITVFNGGEELVLSNNGKNNDNFEPLRRGDLITYLLTDEGYIENFLKVRSCDSTYNGLNSYNEFISANELSGIAQSIEFNKVDSINNVKVSVVTLNVSGNEYTINVPVRNLPPIYIYTAGNGEIKPAGLYDIVPGQDLVYTILNTSGIPRGLVIIR